MNAKLLLQAVIWIPLWVVLLMLMPARSSGAEATDESITSRAVSSETLRVARPGISRVLTDRVAIDRLTGAVTDFKVVDLAGNDVTEQTRPEIVDERVTLANPQKKQLIMKTREITTVKAKRNEAVVLPGGIVVPETSSAGATDTGPTPASWLRLTLLASPTPADWDPREGGYFTRLTFGLKNPRESRAPVELEQPVTVKLSFDGLTGSDIPPLTLTDAGLEHEKTVDLHFVPRTANPKVLIRSTISDADLELEALPRLNLVPASDSVLGLGLGTVDVTVTHVLPHGEIVPTTEPTDIVLEVEGGSAKPAAVRLNPGESMASFQLRSAGLGSLNVRASAGPVWGGTVVQQRLFGPLCAALLGGALGGFARRFARGAKQKLATRRVVEGTVVGLVAFVAGAIGIGYLSLPPMIVVTEAGAFLTGVLSGFVGVTVLEKLTSKLHPSKPAAG